jgi:carbamoyltransferase
MKLLAIHYNHNCAVGFAEDGQVKFLISEERFCRMKNATGFPIQTLRYVADTYLDGDPNNADQIAIVDATGQIASRMCRLGIQPRPYKDYYWKKKERLLHSLHEPAHGKLGGIKRFIRARLGNVLPVRADDNDESKLAILREVGLDPKKVRYLDHHACHAWSAAYFAPVCDGDPWLVLTLDGEGDNLSSTVSVLRNGNFTRISSGDRDASLGRIYSETTAYLGMKTNEHEFKLMGMAPYADSEQTERLASELATLISVSGDGTFRMTVPATQVLRSLVPLYAFERFDTIAGAVQKLTEELVCQWAEHWIRETGIHDVAATGGVFMNVKAAKKLSEHPLVNRLFVVPSASDESLPIGGLWHLAVSNGCPVRPIGDLYLGRGISDDDVETMIGRDLLAREFEIEKFVDEDQLANRIGDLLAEDAIVARCSGREEWGARALGNRSILCNPSKFSNVERLNNKIKCRDFWMPFAPSILSEEVSRYVINGKNTFAPYMAITFDSTPLARDHFPAAVHPRDFTMRPQVVTKDWNPQYHAILSAFMKRTGIGGVLNTSFNLHGEPNVSAPEDAIKTVRNSGLDYVVIGKVLFRKRS